MPVPKEDKKYGELPALDLPERLIKGNAGSGGQVQAAHLSTRHGDAQSAIAVTLNYAGRQSVRFAAEQQTLPVLVGGVGVWNHGMGTKAVNSRATHKRLKIFQGYVLVAFDIPPVVEAGSPQR